MSEPKKTRTTGPTTIVSEEQDDGSFEIRTTTLEHDVVEEPSAQPGGSGGFAKASSGDGGSAAAWIGLAVVLALLGAGAYFLFVSPRKIEREPPLVTREEPVPTVNPVGDGIGQGLNERLREAGPLRLQGESESPVIRRTLLRRPQAAETSRVQPAQLRAVALDAGASFDAAPGGSATVIRTPAVRSPGGQLRQSRSQQADLLGPSVGQVELTPQFDGDTGRGTAREETRVLGPTYPSPQRSAARDEDAGDRELDNELLLEHDEARVDPRPGEGELGDEDELDDDELSDEDELGDEDDEAEDELDDDELSDEDDGRGEADDGYSDDDYDDEEYADDEISDDEISDDDESGGFE